MNSTPRRLSSSTVPDDVRRRRTRCAARRGRSFSSTNLSICESRKCGRSGSFVANFTLALRVPHDDRRGRSPRRCDFVATSCVWKLISQNGSKPSTSRYNAMIGCIVRPLRGDVIDLADAVRRSPAGSTRARHRSRRSRARTRRIRRARRSGTRRRRGASRSRRRGTGRRGRRCPRWDRRGRCRRASRGTPSSSSRLFTRKLRLITPAGCRLR